MTDTRTRAIQRRRQVCPPTPHGPLLRRRPPRLWQMLWLVQPTLVRADTGAQIADTSRLWIGACALCLGALLWALLRELAARRALRRHLADEQSLVNMLDQSGLAVWDWDLDADRIRRFGAWEALIGRVNAEATAQEWQGRIAASDADRVAAQLRGLLEGREGQLVTEYGLLSDDGATHRVIERAKVVARREDGRPRRILATVEKLVVGDGAGERTLWLASHDALTGLPNRLVLSDRLHQALHRADRRKHQVAVIYLDIDHFKHINDQHGHRIGDTVLVQLALRLQRSLRKMDTVSRRGGDEFVILLTELDNPMQAAKVCEKIALQIREPLQVDSLVLQMSASMGVAMYPQDAADGDTLLQLADMALYRSKGAGRRRITFYEADINRSLRESADMESRLRAALGQRSFVLWYQPQFDLATGELVGVEALLRWIDDDGSMLLPSQFIPVAERYGHIHALGDWTIQTACTEIKAIQELLKRPLQVAVNVSPVQLRGPGLQACVRRALDDAAWPASQLVLEANELAVMDDVDTARRTLAELEALGVGLAIDNFGVGLSRVPMLRHYHLRQLKIDRSLVKEMASGSDHEAVVNGIIRMAHSLGLRVVAEGVETPAQAGLLRLHGCDAAQGHLFCPAVPKEHLSQLPRQLPGDVMRPEVAH